MMLRGGVVLAALMALSAAFAGEARAVALPVNCGGGATYLTIQAAVDDACSGDTISVVGACNESVMIKNDNAGCHLPPVAMPFTKLTITGTSNASNNFNPGPGPAFLITGNAYNITISNFIVGAAAGNGIEVLGAHRVTLQNIKTNSTTHASGDGINIDTASTRVRVLSSTLNNNGGDGLENGSTDGEVTSVTANDNELVGIHVPGSNPMVTRCTANETSGVPKVQDEGFRFDGPGAIVQQNNAKDNAVAQFRDTIASTGVIHFRNIAGNSSATISAGSTDVQALPVGSVAPGTDCITKGPNMTLDTAPSGDDSIVGTKITTGNDGICDSTAAVDDVQVLPIGQPEPNTDCVTPGTDMTLESSPSGDDVVAVNKIDSGANGICESSAVAGAGFLEEGSGNRINTCSVFRNVGDGVRIDGSGNTLQLSTISSNKGSQVRITGDNNFIQTNTITRVSTVPFASATPAVDAAGADANFFQSNRVSVAGTNPGDGYTVPATNNGLQNTRAPSVNGMTPDPPNYLR